ncbi:MAG: hypothetical protein AB7G23_17885 [Vicinamibacterales bacterium]
MSRWWHALAAYVALTVAATWPLARRAGTDIAWDLGDPVLNTWIIGRNCQRILDALGNPLQWRGFFDGGIFHPAPLTLAYSEHLLGPTLQALPVYAITANPVLCYNLLLLATYALSGFGMYLFVRDRTGSGTAAFVAGVAFAFAPYRAAHLSHLQILSAQWMPLALFGIHRYLNTGGRLPLAGAALSLLLLNLSSGYYLFFFSPFAALYVVWELARRGRLGDTGAWRHFSVAAGSVVLLTGLSVVPYIELQRQLGMSRGLAEVRLYSADVYAYVTASPALLFWGDVVGTYPKLEGQLFPGLTVLVLAVVAVLTATGSGRRPAPSPRRRWAIRLVGGVALAHLVGAVAVVLARRIAIDSPVPLRLADATSLLVRGALATVVLFALSPRMRETGRRLLSSEGYFVVGALLAAWLTLGPVPESLGQPVALASPYRVAYDYLPGFDGLRVPARFAMVLTFMLAVLAGSGAARVSRRAPRTVGLLLTAALLLEGWVSPFVLNGAPAGDPASVASRLGDLDSPGPVYATVAALEPDAVIAELPLGGPFEDVRFMYQALGHRHRLINGYSGFFPEGYRELATVLSTAAQEPGAALRALETRGATHAIVHASLMGEEGALVEAALVSAGATPLARDGDVVLLALP